MKDEIFVNRNQKDTVFRILFRDRERLLELYNAVAQTNYKDPKELHVVTLENAVFMSMKNDLAFIIDFGLYLYEHQSTINPNLPLRFLHYVSREYEQLTEQRLLYGRRPVPLPAPHFVVFYNGVEELPERQELRLSDLYIRKREEGRDEMSPGEETPCLDLKVVVLNINRGKNQKLLSDCKTLRDYARYTQCVREYRQNMSLRDAVIRAVDECIRNDILSDFLRKNKSEVVSMSIFEYDEEGVRELWRQEAIEDGRAEGLAEGLEKGLADGRAEGIIETGFDCGLSETDILERLQKKLNVSLQRAQEYLQKFGTRE